MSDSQRQPALSPAPQDFAQDMSEKCRLFFDYWLSLRNGRLVPRKRDFNPVDVPSLLSNIWIQEYAEEQNTFICRLAGEQVNNAWHASSVAGKDTLSIVGESNLAKVMDRWLRIIQGPSLFHGAEYLMRNNIPGRGVERFIAPFAKDDGRVDFIIGFSLYSASYGQDDSPSVDNSQIKYLNCTDC
ncbi:PAS domain-containing protein [Rhodovibrionaceae bacterium A322]